MNPHGKRPSEKTAPPEAVPSAALPDPRERDAQPSDDLENTELGNIGHAPEGPDADPDPSIVPLTTTMGGATTRGEYTTDPATGGGRYMGHGSGTFGMDPVDPPAGEPEAIDPKI